MEGQKRKSRERKYGEGFTVLKFMNLREGNLLVYPSVWVLAWFFLHHVKSHTGNSQRHRLMPWHWPADMSTVKETFWEINLPGIPRKSKKITEGVFRASLLLSPSRLLGLLVCLYCSQSVSAKLEWSPSKLWGICFSCQGWSVLIFSYSGAEREARATHGDTDGCFHFKFTASETLL